MLKTEMIMEKVLYILVNINAFIFFQFCSLMLSYKIAIQHGHTEIYQLLLDNGSEVNLKDKDGYTPLHYGEFLLNN
jgi:hypothetical protein